MDVDLSGSMLPASTYYENEKGVIDVTYDSWRVNLFDDAGEFDVKLLGVTMTHRRTSLGDSDEGTVFAEDETSAFQLIALRHCAALGVSEQEIIDGLVANIQEESVV